MIERELKVNNQKIDDFSIILNEQNKEKLKYFSYYI